MIEKIFAPQLLGLTALERESVHERLDRTVGNPAAKAAIDMALWDILGRAAGMPVSGLLGGYSDRMRVSHMVGFAPAAEMVAEAERIRDTYGITTFKVKVGRQPYTEDVTACRALREALGPDVDLYIDGNRGWTASDAVRALREMADLGLTFAEELCPADDVLGRRWLVAQSPVLFIADESATRAAEVTRELLGGSATAISIKTARTGFIASQRVLHECEGLGVEVVMGNQIDGGIGTLCSVAFGAAHGGAGAVPDPDGRLVRQADRGRGLARLAPGSPAPQVLGARPPTDHHPAVLQGRQPCRRRHRLRREARADPRPGSGCGRQRPRGHVRLRPRQGVIDRALRRTHGRRHSARPRPGGPRGPGGP
ncbi:enolase C-terminal domain-like protein [Streptomyces brasiliensis]|uniref:enolase C-terminal domain-like protein n=1 Tax=Streptomyces brasiliensis TaxID=1954 RepID=UPI004032AF42